MSDVVGSAAFELRATRQQMKKDLEEAKRDLGGFVNEAEREVGGSTSRLGGMMGKLGLAVGALSAAIGVGIAMIVKFGSASLEMADALSDSAQRIGIGAEALQEWQYVARKTGQDANQVSGALEDFSNRAAQAAAGLNKSAKDAFKAIGFEQADLRSFKDTEGLIDAVTDRIGELKNEADRAAIAEKLGLGPLSTALREGSDEVARLRDEAAALGFVMDEALIQKGAEAQGQLEDLSQVIGIQMAEAFIGLSDEVLAFTGYIADALRGLNAFIERFNEGRQRASMIYGGDVIGMAARGETGQAVRTAASAIASGQAARMTSAYANPTYENSDDPALQRQQAAIAGSVSATRGRGNSGRTGLTPVTPRDRADNSADRARRAAEQEARRSERVEEEIARARIRVLGIVDDEAQTVQQRYDTAKAQVEAEREAEAKNLESRKARKDITQAEFDQLTLINTQTATLEDRVASDVLARDLADERLAKERALNDLTVDLLSIQAGSARTAGERARLERQLLQMAQRRAREDLETELSRTPGLSEDDKRNRRGRLADVQRAQSEAIRNQNLTPLQAWRDASLKSIGEVNEAYEGIAARGLDALNDGIVDAIMNSKNLGDVFSNVAKQIMADLLAISVRKSITEPLADMLFPGKGSSGGGIGSLFSRFLKIGSNANGTDSWAGGLTYINEGMRGEIVNLPNGTQIIPHDISMKMAAGAGKSSSAGAYFDLRGAVLTQDLVDQMNAIGRAAEDRAHSRALNDAPKLTMSQTAKQQTHSVGRRRR